uniref:Uncharacterized protein n=1 Tax=Plectus sambesii TaxID=2011161 RepID=A0A914XK09_9BILA
MANLTKRKSVPGRSFATAKHASNALIGSAPVRDGPDGGSTDRRIRRRFLALQMFNLMNRGKLPPLASRLDMSTAPNSIPLEHLESPSMLVVVFEALAVRAPIVGI